MCHSYCLLGGILKSFLSYLEWAHEGDVSIPRWSLPRAINGLHPGVTDRFKPASLCVTVLFSSCLTLTVAMETKCRLTHSQASLIFGLWGHVVRMRDKQSSTDRVRQDLGGDRQREDSRGVCHCRLVTNLAETWHYMHTHTHTLLKSQ